jgi:hypothetical protein
MITEIILGLIIVFLLVERYLYSKTVHKQFNEFTRALISRSSIEYSQSKVIEKPLFEENTQDPFEKYNITSVEELSNEEFNKHIKDQLNV